MILVRTNPKLALVIVCLSLLVSVFTVWKVTHTTDKVAQQGIELQRDAMRQTNQAIKDAQLQTDTTDRDVQAQVDDAQRQASKIADDAQAQVDAATAQLEAATK